MSLVEKELPNDLKHYLELNLTVTLRELYTATLKDRTQRTTDRQAATYRHNANRLHFKVDVYAMTTFFHGLNLYLHL